MIIVLIISEIFKKICASKNIIKIHSNEHGLKVSAFCIIIIILKSMLIKKIFIGADCFEILIQAVSLK